MYILQLFKPLSVNWRAFNPNSTGQGQSWPRQLWRQIPDKILGFFYLTFSCKNVFQIFFNFWHDVKKQHFDVHFDVFFVRRSVVSLLCHHPLLPTGFTAITDHLSVGEVPPGRGLQCSAAPLKLWPVFGPGLRRVRGEAGSQSGRSLALSQCINVAAPVWADYQNRSTLYIRAKYREKWVYTTWKWG